jgi:membrane-bound ClpP family serine protease
MNMNKQNIVNNRTDRYGIPHRMALSILTGLTFLTINVTTRAQSASKDSSPDDSAAVIIEINPTLTPAGLSIVNRQIDEALKKNCQTIIFEFSGRGLSFEGFRDLAQKIIDLAKNNGIHTVAYIPKEAKQMNMLAVYACRDIIANELAQLGQVIPPVQLPDPSVPYVNYDEQSVLNLIEELARLTKRNPLLSRAMTQRATTLTEIRRQGNTQTELVDQAGMSELSKPGSPPWEKVRTWVDSGSVLLLTGSQTRELKLVTNFASSRENLAEILGVKLLELESTKKTAAQDEPNQSQAKGRPDPADGKPPKAVVITIADMIDPGLVESLKRRTEFAIDHGATIIIYEMDTFGGRVDSAIEIYDYFLKDVGRRAGPSPISPPRPSPPAP